MSCCGAIRGREVAAIYVRPFGVTILASKKRADKANTKHMVRLAEKKRQDGHAMFAYPQSDLKGVESLGKELEKNPFNFKPIFMKPRRYNLYTACTIL